MAVKGSKLHEYNSEINVAIMLYADLIAQRLTGSARVLRAIPDITDSR